MKSLTHFISPKVFHLNKHDEYWVTKQSLGGYLRFEVIGDISPMVEDGYHHFDRVLLSSLFCHLHAQKLVIVKTGQGVDVDYTTFAFLLDV